MAWGTVDNPAAASRAGIEAREALETRRMTPFERALLAVLNQIRDALEAQRPAPLEPLIGYFSGGPDCGLLTETPEGQTVAPGEAAGSAENLPAETPTP